MKTKQSIGLRAAFGMYLVLLPLSASAFYNPTIGRWLNRDPFADLAASAQVASFLSPTSSQLTIVELGGSYRFAWNDTINAVDVLGLFDGNLPHRYWPHEFPMWPPNTKECGTIVSRATYAGPWWHCWDILTAKCTPHMFLILEDGTRLTNGGTSDGEGHYTATVAKINIPKNADCAQFTQCLKDYFAVQIAKGFDIFKNNCHIANDAVEHCKKNIGGL